MELIIPGAIESMETEENQINEKLGEDGEVDEGTIAKLFAKFKCKHCDFLGSSQRQLYKHMKMLHPDKKKDRKTKTHVRGRPLYSCKYCDFIGANQREKINHQRNMDPSAILSLDDGPHIPT